MIKNFNRTADTVAVSFNREARSYFAGQYYRAYFYFYGSENTDDLARQAVC